MLPLNSEHVGGRFTSGSAPCTGADPGYLKGTLGGVNALDCSDAGQVHQLVSDIAEALSYAVNPAKVNQKDVDRVYSQ